MQLESKDDNNGISIKIGGDKKGDYKLVQNSAVKNGKNNKMNGTAKNGEQIFLVITYYPQFV